MNKMEYVNQYISTVKDSDVFTIDDLSKAIYEKLNKNKNLIKNNTDSDDLLKLKRYVTKTLNDLEKRNDINKILNGIYTSSKTLETIDKKEFLNKYLGKGE